MTWFNFILTLIVGAGAGILIGLRMCTWMIFDDIKENGVHEFQNQRIVGHVETLKGWEKD